MSYAWENNLERSWDALVEDEHGVLRATIDVDDPASLMRSRRLDDGKTVCRNMIRYVCVVIDMSRAMAENDLRPSRRAVTLELLKEFVISFLDENPLSSLSIFACVDGMAEKLTELSGSAKNHLAGLEILSERGEFSLQNGLELARASLNAVPQHGSKEIITIMASLSTCDQGDIFETIEALEKKNIRCSVIGLSAEVYVAKHVTMKTNGVYDVACSKTHFKNLLMSHIEPPPVLVENQNGLRCTFIRMGFPSQGAVRDTSGGGGAGITTTRQALSTGPPPKLTKEGFYCPRCNAVCEELPSKCSICDLELIASSHLARSYHHLFPVPRFEVVKLAEAVSGGNCSSCGVPFGDSKHKLKAYFKCPACESFVCDLCESFIHETLHNCPACLQQSAELDLLA